MYRTGIGRSLLSYLNEGGVLGMSGGNVMMWRGTHISTENGGEIHAVPPGNVRNGEREHFRTKCFCAISPQLGIVCAEFPASLTRPPNNRAHKPSICAETESCDRPDISRFHVDPSRQTIAPSRLIIGPLSQSTARLRRLSHIPESPLCNLALAPSIWPETAPSGRRHISEFPADSM